MQHHHHTEISDSYHCKRSQSGDVVHVYNSNNYLMAEYIVGTGRTSWQRVAPLTQRESVEKWLQEQLSRSSRRSGTSEGTGHEVKERQKSGFEP